MYVDANYFVIEAQLVRGPEKLFEEEEKVTFFHLNVSSGIIMMWPLIQRIQN